MISTFSPVSSLGQDDILALFILLEAGHLPDGPVDPPSGGVVVEQHDLGALLELQFQGRGQVFLAEISFDDAVDRPCPAGQSGESLLIDPVGQFVGAGQVDVKVLGRRVRIRDRRAD